MKLKNKTKFLLVFGIILVAFLLFNINKVSAATNGEESSLDNIPNTIDLDIKEIEWQKAEQLVWEKLVAEQKVTESDKDSFYFWVIGLDVRTARLGLNGREKNVSINYSNTKNYNESDKTYIENLLKNKDFSLTNNNNYRGPNLHISIEVGIDKLDYENCKNRIIKVFKEYINDNSIEFTYHGGGGDITGAVSSICIFKNDIFYTNVNLDTVNDFIVMVPNNIENSEDKYIDYAKSKIKSEMNITENLDIKKISGYWYEINNWGSSLIIKKTEGAYIGNNIFVDNLAQGVNVTVTTKENDTMKTEIKNKGYTNILGSYELTLAGADTLVNPIDITFNVGTEYNGKTVYILHQKKNGTYENFEKKVTDGKVTITVSELSPFVLGVKEETTETDNTTTTATTNKGEKDDTPKTGTVDIIGYVSLITIMSMVGIVTLKRKLK